MSNSLRRTALASLMGATFACASIHSVAADSEPPTWIIRFSEPGVVHYKGGIGSLQATAVHDGHFDARSSDVQSYRAYLDTLQAQHVADITAAIGRAPDVTHSYQMVRSGIAVKLTEAEAATVRALPGITAVDAEQVHTLQTYRGPTFIGADSIWNASPSATYRGRGVVIGMLDGGTNSTHPSFANDASCGFTAEQPKLLSARDCSTSTDGVCNGPNPEDTSEGHGVHTASTAAGNVLNTSVSPPPTIPAPYTQMSGVAPCASIRSYRICPDTTCPDSNILAGIDNVLADGDVDVVNYSVSGGTAPWGDIDRDFLDLVDSGIFVAAAAGNISANMTDPVGQVNHRGPWVMSVAAVTHDAVPLATLSVTAPGTPEGLQNLALDQGSTTPVGALLQAEPIRDYPDNVLGCTDSGGFPAGYFSGAAALIERGTCTFGEKITNAFNAGAELVIIGNNDSGALSMDTSGAPEVPAYSIANMDIANALIAYVEANAGSAEVTFDPDGRQGDRLASFSLRGPTPAPLGDLTKPDIAAPGVQIYAALNAENGQYGYMSGTSMASPHVAGAAALMRALHPAWSPMAIKSALQMTAKSSGFAEDGSTAWTIDDVGSGRVNLTAAMRTGLVMEESYDDFVAAGAGTIALADLNLPSLRNVSCATHCSFTRTLTSSLSTGSSWSAAFESADPDGIQVSVEPSTFTVGAGQSVTLTVSVNMGSGDPVASPIFGDIVLTETSDLASTEHLTVAVAGSRLADRIFASGFDGDGDAAHIIRFDNVDFTFPEDYPWGSVDWMSGATCNCNTAPYTFNVWQNAGAIAFAFPQQFGGEGTYGAVADTGQEYPPYLVLHSGTVVGPDSTFGTIVSSLATTNWTTSEGVDGYLGFRFFNTTTQTVNYGYAHLVTSGLSGYPIQLLDYAYNDAGQPITIP